jgi:hypothetical protein
MGMILHPLKARYSPPSMNKMHLSIKNWQDSLPHLAILTSLFLFSGLNAQALSTGIPLQFSIDPGTVRQTEKDETPVTATVILKEPSSNIFVCRIRSGDKNKITFANIVFKKGQSKGTATGIVHWFRIVKNCEVKVSAFNVDTPGEKLWFTIALKTRNLDQSPSRQ